MLAYADYPSHRVLPIGSLLLTLLACVGASYWLVPSESEMVERLMLDKQYERIAGMLNSEMGSGSPVDSSTLHLLPPAQMAVLTELMHLTPREQLNIIFSSSRPPEYNRFIHGLAMGAVRYVNVIQPSEAWQLIGQHAARMSQAQFIDFGVLLSRNALALQQPALAAVILDQVSQLPEAGAQIANDMAQAYRWSLQPARGAERLRAWMLAHADSVAADDATRLRELNAAIALEGGNPALALDICIDDLRAVPEAEPLPGALMDRALSYANQSSRTVVLLPWLQRYVTAMPESSMPLKDLHQIAGTQPQRLQEFKKWATLLAHFADWNSKFDLSFDQHLRLAAAGSLESLDRCVELWDFLGCDQEMIELLADLGPVAERPRLPLVRAAALADVGNDAEAKVFYEQWVAAHPDDRDPLYCLACMLEDIGDEDGCLAALKDLVKRHPTDVPGIKKLAENDIRAGLYDDALHLYSRLDEKDQDNTTLENYCMIAESLDQYVEYFKAEWLTARATNPPAAEPYLNMAQVAARQPNLDTAVKEVARGLEHLPQSAAIRVAVADLWINADEYEKAWAVLRNDSVRHSFDGLSRILDIAPEVPQPDDVLTFLGDDLEKRFQLPPSMRLDLAVLHALCGYTDHAERLFASVPATPANGLIIAQARYRCGGYSQAVALMESYVSASPHVTANDHVFLGDLYELLGRQADADRAYRASIDILATQPAETVFRPSSHQPLARQP